MIRDADEARGKSLEAASRWIEVLCNSANAPEDSSSVEDLLNRALSALTVGEDEKAINYVTEAIRHAPKRAEAYRTRALIYMGKSDFEEAITDLDQAIRLDPEYAEAFGLRASVHTSKERLDRAISDWTSAIRLKPSYADAYCGRAVAYVETGEFEEAIDDATEAIRLDPTDADAYRCRGVAYRARGERDRAFADFARAEDVCLVTNAESPSCEKPDSIKVCSHEHWRERYRKVIYEVERHRRYDVIQNHKNRHGFARAYFAIEKDFGQTMVRVRREIAGGQYTFFAAAGIPDGVMTPDLAKTLLNTWSIAVQSQLQRLALHFQLSWNDRIQKHRPRNRRIGLLRTLLASLAFPFTARPRFARPQPPNK